MLPALASRRDTSFESLSQEVLALSREFSGIHRDIFPDLLVEAYDQSQTLDQVKARLQELEAAYSEKADPVLSQQIRVRLEQELEDGRWPAESEQAVLAELERLAQLERVLGGEDENLMDRVFQQVRERLSPEQVAPNIELDDGGVLIGGDWVPIED